MIVKLEMETVVSTFALPFAPPAPSKTALCVDSGTLAPPEPALVFDQLLVSFQFPAPVATQ